MKTSPRSAPSSPSADPPRGEVKAALAAHDYMGTFDHARAAYEWALRAAAKVGVAVERSEARWFVLPPRREIKGPVKREFSFADRYTETSQRAKP